MGRATGDGVRSWFVSDTMENGSNGGSDWFERDGDSSIREGRAAVGMDGQGGLLSR